MIVSKYEDVTLRLFEESDILKKVEWINNPENNQYLHYDLPLRIDKTTEWFRNKNNNSRVDCVIEYDGQPVGLIGLLSIDKVNFKAEYYITIGETSCKHKGIATKATRAILEYAFSVLKLHKVYLTVDAENVAAKKLYEKVGFQQEGLLIDDLYNQYENRFIDRERLAVLKNRGGKSLYFAIDFISFYKSESSYDTDIRILKNTESKNEIYIKRDDLIPYSFGGNKARKAQYFFREIDGNDYNYIVTYGSGSSNHCRVIANMAASRNIPCDIISPEEVSEVTYNSKMMQLFGANIIICPVSEVSEIIQRRLQELKSNGYHPYFIQGGGHGNLGTQAYVDCYQEILQFEKENHIRFDYIFHASGTGTTQAGLVCGKMIYHGNHDIIGISIARKNPRGRNVVIDSIKGYFQENHISFSEEIINQNVVFIDDYTGDGYGKDNPEIIAVIKDMLIRHGVPMDSTYTAKAYTGMMSYLEENRIENKNILFIHTGGTPLFFDDLSKF